MDITVYTLGYKLSACQPPMGTTRSVVVQMHPQWCVYEALKQLPGFPEIIGISDGLCSMYPGDTCASFDIKDRPNLGGRARPRGACLYVSVIPKKKVETSRQRNQRRAKKKARERERAIQEAQGLH